MITLSSKNYTADAIHLCQILGSGKSTLVNTICEMKVSITSPTPQTTRNKIRGIYTVRRAEILPARSCHFTT